MQERVLAPRNLHFGDEYVLWECEVSTASEIYPQCQIKFGAPVKAGSIRRMGYAPDPEEHWQQIVEVYSKCLLTNENDKLVAVGGIAKRFAQTKKLGVYLAGLWSHNLVPQLLWQSRSPSKSVRPNKYRAPTWSWASLDGPVFPLDDWETERVRVSTKVMVAVGEVLLTHLTENPYGEILAAKLEISGNLSSFTFENEFGDWNIKVESIGGQRMISCSHVRLSIDVGTVDPKLLTNLFFLPLIQSTHSNSSRWYTGLLLEPTADATSVFRRCGVFKIWDATLFCVSDSPLETTTGLSSDTSTFDGRIRKLWIV